LADERAFDWACDALERESSLNRLEARGTVRLALRQAGLESKSVTPEQIAIVFDKLLPQELVARSIGDAERICTRIASAARELDPGDGSDTDSPEAVFSRLGG
jgi:hypothetical protein